MTPAAAILLTAALLAGDLALTYWALRRGYTEEGYPWAWLGAASQRFAVIAAGNAALFIAVALFRPAEYVWGALGGVHAIAIGISLQAVAMRWWRARKGRQT